MKVILIGGYPGVGKSTLIRKFVEIGESQYVGGKFVSDTDYGMEMLIKGDVIILGSYSPNEKFPGTDRFSMAIQPKFEQFLLDPKYKDSVIILEGDRLFNGKTIAFLYQHKIPYTVIILQADMSIIRERRDNRSKQDENWRKGRQTKVDNIAKQIPHTVLVNNNKEELESSTEYLIHLLDEV